MIPEAKQFAVQRALHSTFGVDEYDSLERLTRSLSSAQIYRIVVRRQSYLLRVIMREDAIADPARQFACMRAAAAAGLAPRVLYASVEDRVLISDFIQEQPFPFDMAIGMAAALRTLHGLSPFPNTITYLDVMDGAVKRFQAAALLPADEMAAFSEGYARTVAAYPRHEWDQVPCHNDLKPDNVLFDGDRLWLVDWEAAFRNDRFTELAVVANFYVEQSQEAEQAYLHTYFGNEPGMYRSAQFFVMRQYMSAIYAAFFLTSALRLGATIMPDMELPSFWQYHQKLVGFRIHLLHPQHQAEYGLLHFRHALQQMRTQRFADALNVLEASR